MLEHSFAFEVQNGVDDVLERFGACDAAALGHVSDRKDRGFGFLGEAHQTGGTFAHLSYVTGRSLEIACEDRLNGVHDHRVKFLRSRRRNDGFEQRLVEQRDIFSRAMKALGAQLDLQR